MHENCIAEKWHKKKFRTCRKMREKRRLRKNARECVPMTEAAKPCRLRGPFSLSRHCRKACPQTRTGLLVYVIHHPLSSTSALNRQQALLVPPDRLSALIHKVEQNILFLKLIRATNRPLHLVIHYPGTPLELPRLQFLSSIILIGGLRKVKS